MKILITGGSGFIGTNLVEYMVANGHEVVNFDIKDPLEKKHAPYLFRGDIIDAAAVNACFNKFQPDAVVHLAARPDLNGKTVEPYYAANTIGTKNLLDAIKSTPSVKRAIMTSTQYVCQPGYTPKSVDDYYAHTAYGQSKVETERLTKAANLNCVWTIIRPTIIWGPWNTFYRDALFSALEKRYYFQPSGRSCVQGFGYVGNMVRQIDKLLHMDAEKIHKKTVYIGDGLIPLYDWINGFSRELTGRNVMFLPRWFVYSLAKFGDVFEMVTGKKFLMYTFRYRNMTVDYPTPLDETLKLLGKPEISLEQGIKETVAWARQHPGK